MFQVFRDWLTFHDTQWFETLPFFCGGALLVVEMLVRYRKGRRPVLATKPLVYAFGEGVSLATIGTYAFALIFNQALAAAIATKNGKIVVVAMVVAFISILRHLIDGWTDAEEHA